MNEIQPVLSEEELKLLLSADQVQVHGTGEELAGDAQRPLGDAGAPVDAGALADQVAHLQGEVAELSERLERQERLVRQLVGGLERVEGLEKRLAGVKASEEAAQARPGSTRHSQLDGSGRAESQAAETASSSELTFGRTATFEAEKDKSPSPGDTTPSRLATYGRRKRRL